MPYNGSTGIADVCDSDINVSWNGSMLRVKDGFDRLTVCDLSGRTVITLVSADEACLTPLASGYYIVTILRGQKQKVMKIMAD